MQKNRLAIAAFALLAGIATLGSQGNLILPTTGTFSGVEFSNLITAANLANASCHAGASAPANATGGAPVAGQCWYDTSTTPRGYKIFDGTAWVSIGRVDASGHIYIPQSGGGAATLASGSTVDLCSVPDNFLTITGSVTITSFGAGACALGQFKVIRFNDPLTLTHGTNLRIPGSANFAADNNDIAIAIRATATRWDVMTGRVAEAAPPPEPVSGIEVPIGAMIEWAGFELPDAALWRWCTNQNITRATFPEYTAAVTKIASVTRQSGSATLTGLTGATTEHLRAGMDIEGTGIPAGAQISSVQAQSVIMTANATSGGTANATFFAWGNGDGSTTIGLPDKRGRVGAGRDNMNNSPAGRLTAAAPTLCDAGGLGLGCGNQQGTLTEAQLPDLTKSITGTITINSAGAHTHTYNDQGRGQLSVDVSNATADAARPNSAELNTGSSGSHAHTNSHSLSVSFGSGAAHTRVQPTLVTNCIVRVK